MKIHLILFLLIFIIPACRQVSRVQRFPAEKEYFSERPGSYSSFYPRLLTGDTLQTDVKKYAFTIPDSFFKKKTAWGSLYFTGLRKNRTRHAVFYLLSDFEKDSLQFLPDLNGNADFRDDRPIRFRKGDWFEVALRNQYDKKAILKYQLKFRDDNPDTANNFLYSLFSKKWKNLLPPNNVIQEKSLYIRKIRMPGGQTVSLADVNHNGWYYRKWDKIITGDINDNIRVYNDPVHSRYVRKGISLVISQSVYKLVKTGRNGDYIKLKKFSAAVDTTDRLPAFNYRDSLDIKREFHPDAQSKLIVLYVWGSWCIGCHTQAPYLQKLMNDYNGIVPFYWLNTGDTRESMYKYLGAKNISGRDWRISAETAALLGADSFPNYIVINSKGLVLLRSSNVTNLIDFVKKRL